MSFGIISFVFLFACNNIKVKIYGSLVLPVVFCGCETWFLTWREENIG